MANQPERVDRLEQQVKGLELATGLGDKRLDAVEEKADETQATASGHTTSIAVLEQRVAALEKQQEDAGLVAMKERVDLLMREREAAISRRWQLGITLFVGITSGIIVGLVVGVVLAGLGLRK